MDIFFVYKFVQKDKSLVSSPRPSIPHPLGVEDSPLHREQRIHPLSDREYPGPRNGICLKQEIKFRESILI